MSAAMGYEPARHPGGHHVREETDITFVSFSFGISLTSAFSLSSRAWWPQSPCSPPSARSQIGCEEHIPHVNAPAVSGMATTLSPVAQIFVSACSFIEGYCHFVMALPSTLAAFGHCSVTPGDGVIGMPNVVAENDHRQSDNEKPKENAEPGFCFLFCGRCFGEIRCIGSRAVGCPPGPRRARRSG
jgi:hypothetical protein